MKERWLVLRTRTFRASGLGFRDVGLRAEGLGI